MSLKKVFKYMNKTFSIDRKFAEIPDDRHRSLIKITSALTVVLVGFIAQKPSFYDIFDQSNFKRRTAHLFKKGTRLPDVDSTRELLSNLPIEELQRINIDVVKKIRKNKVFSKGTIDGLTVAAIDGVELFSSEKKWCKNCLTREMKKGVMQYFHRSVVCMSVGSDPHIIFGQDMLKPRDGSQKDEGELTGGKRLIEKLYNEHHHFADVIVGDALYMNAPFIKCVTDKKIDVVIRAKDESRTIIQDALGIVNNRQADRVFKADKKTVEVWTEDSFKMDGLDKELRFIKYKEKSVNSRGKEIESDICVITTLKAKEETVLKIMHKRWHIELNGFRELKTKYHVDHCFVHGAVENVFMLNILAFNIREMYLFRQIRDFRSMKITRRSVTVDLCDELLLEDLSECFCFNSG